MRLRRNIYDGKVVQNMSRTEDLYYGFWVSKNVSERAYETFLCNIYNEKKKHSTEISDDAA